MIACILIVSEKRIPLVREKVLPSVLRQRFDEVIWVGDGEPGDDYRFLSVPPLSRTTNDALVKRDVGTLASQADVLIYLSDDHALEEHFGEILRHWCSPEKLDTWDILAPSRYCKWNGKRIQLNSGWTDWGQGTPPYIGGHGGVYKRYVVTRCPWAARPHDLLWDLIITQQQKAEGDRIVYVPELAIQDMEPEHSPWL